MADGHDSVPDARHAHDSPPDTTCGPPDALRAAIARDLSPVTPLPAPSRRLLAMVPLAFLSLVFAVLIFGMRRDAPSIGLALTWGASVIQIALGLALIAGALREAVPGTTLPRRVIGAVLGTALLAVPSVTFVTWFASPTFVPSRIATFVWGVCFTGTIVGALPALALSGWLVSRAFPLRPGLAGALYGIGAGLMADGGWRLFCHFSHPLHVFGAHTLGVVTAGVLGIVLAVTLARRK